LVRAPLATRRSRVESPHSRRFGASQGHDGAWVGNATEEAGFSNDWRELAVLPVDRIACVVVDRRAGMLVVRGLGKENGGLAIDISSLGQGMKARCR
jgi:hypothetical protein